MSFDIIVWFVYIQFIDITLKNINCGIHKEQIVFNIDNPQNNKQKYKT